MGPSPEGMDQGEGVDGAEPIDVCGPNLASQDNFAAQAISAEALRAIFGLASAAFDTWDDGPLAALAADEQLHVASVPEVRLPKLAIISSSPPNARTYSERVESK